MESLFYNSDAGFLEGIVRGYKSGILTSQIYSNLTQCETLDDIKLQLSATDYSTFLQNESTLTTSTIADRARMRLVDDFNFLRLNATSPLSQFLDYITYAYIIDNVILLITGTFHSRDTNELLDRCHPLGLFDGIAALCVATSVSEIYNTVMIDSPISSYFERCLSASDLDELNIEIIRNTLYKAYLEDFYDYVSTIGGPTASVMLEILQFEADRRTINITINSFNTDLSKDDRQKLFPTNGKLYPEGIMRLSRADDIDQVKTTLDQYSDYRVFFEGTLGEKSLEDKFFEHEVFLNKKSFMAQFGFGVFYAWLKLKEQEVRNLVWICECVVLGRRDKVGNYLVIF